jgi:acetyltransferase-like isoleucine patch superfamily enzyme
MSIRDKLDRLYGAKRGLSGGIDPRVPLAQILQVVATKLMQRVRGVVRGMPRTYIGRGVRIAGRSHLRVGTNVVVADGVAIVAFSANGVSLGDSVTIDSRTSLRATAVIRNLGTGISVGDRTAIGANNVILGQGGVEIGSDCLFGPNVTLLSENHASASTIVPIRVQGEVRKKLVIGDDVWIGAGATVLGGVTVGSGAIIAAGAVVSKDVAEYTVVGGVPAVLLRNRIQEER